jgi:hypothetical protein
MSGIQEEYNEMNQDGFQCPGEFFTKLNQGNSLQN